MAITKINADAMDLTDAYAFTGTVTGAGVFPKEMADKLKSVKDAHPKGAS